MPRQMAKYSSKFGKWCNKENRRIGLTLVQVSEDTGLAYRTVWMAANGWKVSYDTARCLHAYTGKVVSVQSLCSAPSRTELYATG
jgi:hypothetical protein